jgi:O-glycosyl hydrolase
VGGEILLDVGFGRETAAAVIDRWDTAGRSFQVRAALRRGSLAAGASASLATALRLTNKTAAPAARLTVDASRSRYHFDGFGANYCWNNASPVATYTLENLKLAWARSEMKVQQWDRERDNPGAAIRADMETMRRFQQAGVPYVISIWWLPERFYTDPYEKPRSTHFRKINPETWDELLDLIGGYLLYARREFGVEPDLFSFNEANIGVYVGLTPEDHLQAIKRFGAHFRKLGLKTKMLLGDATGPRDTHKFVLEAAADPDAMQYVSAVAFHSWGGGTREQYTAWGDVAEWLKLPLLVTELGVDAAAYNNRAYDSYHYGLREAEMTQELLIYARPQGTQYWQFTNDYGLARARQGGSVEPTPRFWLMKHFTDLTPQKSEALAATSDQPSVLFTAFRAGSGYALHILNLGGTREVSLEGVPDAEWQATESTETAQYKARPAGRAAAGKLSFQVPARSLVTLTGK